MNFHSVWTGLSLGMLVFSERAMRNQPLASHEQLKTAAEPNADDPPPPNLYGWPQVLSFTLMQHTLMAGPVVRVLQITDQAQCSSGLTRASGFIYTGWGQSHFGGTEGHPGQKMGETTDPYRLSTDSRLTILTGNSDCPRELTSPVDDNRMFLNSFWGWWSSMDW